MKVLIISPGKAHDASLKDAISEYEKRLSKRLPIEWLLPKPSDKETEAKAILKALKDDDFVILLDERGNDIDTPGLAKLISKLEQESTKRLVIIIGGAFGVAGEIVARADLILKLSSLVFPHMLVRLILAEQLYRAVSILEGGKYHHA
ncbi:MAG TPA: 23S rRNA (pseudouridine(1915)-N(3))-methyltransferase RlmH [Candidatus Paceibacterota bacterium]|nr:23S rRNA (pseudouridine(1915)-N(3))-methyltransferase RlmH [Candidatus Paceibacterota bacterium]